VHRGTTLARMAASDDRVELTELDVITRYSLAVRSATAPREDLIAALRADLAWLEGGRTRRRTTSTATATAGKKATPAKKTGAGRSRAAGH
jgi:hypothetical protein